MKFLTQTCAARRPGGSLVEVDSSSTQTEINSVQVSAGRPDSHSAGIVNELLQGVKLASYTAVNREPSGATKP
jgi:hypothetical protein